MFSSLTKEIPSLPLLFIIILISACSPRSPEASGAEAAGTSPIDSVEGNQQRRLQAFNEDSVRARLGIQDSIRVIKTVNMSGDIQFAFIDYNKHSIFHADMRKFFGSKRDEETRLYNETYTQFKKEYADSVQALPKSYTHLKGQWLEIGFYEGKPYVSDPCEFIFRFEISDSTFVHHSMDGIYPDLILSVKRDGHTTKLRRSFRGEIDFTLVDPSYRLYKVREGDACHYVIPLSEVHKLPIIEEFCVDEGAIVRLDRVECP